MTLFIQLILSGMVSAAVYVLIGYGFILTWRVARVFNLAQVASGVFGAFLCLFMFDSGVNLLVSALVGIASAAVLGLLTERVIINPLRFSKISGWLLGTLAVNIMITVGLTWWWGSEHVPFPPLLGFQTNVSIMGAVTDSNRLMAIATSTLIVLAIEAFLGWTIWGKAMRATAYDRQAADLMGISTGMVVIVVFMISSAISALSIMLQGPITYLTPAMTFMLIIKGFVAAIIGGLDSKRGIIVGALILGLLEAVGNYFVPTGYQEVFSFAFLIIVLAFKPQGLFGEVETREV